MRISDWSSDVCSSDLFWSPIDKASGPTERVGKLVQTHVVPFSDRFTFVEDDGGVAPGITPLDAGGHTPGLMAFHVESRGQQLLVHAPVANHYVLPHPRPARAMSSDTKPKTQAQPP